MIRFIIRFPSECAEFLAGAGEADVTQLYEDTVEHTGGGTLTWPTLGTLAPSAIGTMSGEVIPTSSPLLHCGSRTGVFTMHIWGTKDSNSGLPGVCCLLDRLVHSYSASRVRDPRRYAEF